MTTLAKQIVAAVLDECQLHGGIIADQLERRVGAILAAPAIQWPEWVARPFAPADARDNKRTVMTRELFDALLKSSKRDPGDTE